MLFLLWGGHKIDLELIEWRSIDHTQSIPPGLFSEVLSPKSPLSLFFSSPNCPHELIVASDGSRCRQVVVSPSPSTSLLSSSVTIVVAIVVTIVVAIVVVSRRPSRCRHRHRRRILSPVALSPSSLSLRHCRRRCRRIVVVVIVIIVAPKESGVSSCKESPLARSQFIIIIVVAII